MKKTELSNDEKIRELIRWNSKYISESTKLSIITIIISIIAIIIAIAS